MIEVKSVEVLSDHGLFGSHALAWERETITAASILARQILSLRMPSSAWSRGQSRPFIATTQIRVGSRPACSSVRTETTRRQSGWTTQSVRLRGTFSTRSAVRRWCPRAARDRASTHRPRRFCLGPSERSRNPRRSNAGTEVPPPPPAMPIYDTLIAPSDGVILSPEDIAASVRDRLPEAEVVSLCRLLEATQEQWMEAWSGD